MFSHLTAGFGQIRRTRTHGRPTTLLVYSKHPSREEDVYKFVNSTAVEPVMNIRAKLSDLLSNEQPMTSLIN